MRSIIIIACIFLTSQTFGQNIILEKAEFIDTAAGPTSKCGDDTWYYYQIGGKYPENSTSVLKELLLFQQDKTQMESGSGNISFRFTVNCEGQVMRRVQVLQTNEKYLPCHFQKPFVDQLFLFFQTLKKWRILKEQNGEPLNYFAFITFKIKNGKVINIIP
jgi:hypothetical protein